MFTTVAFCCVKRDEEFHINGGKMRWQHKLAIAADISLGVSVLALGLLSLCGPSLGLAWKLPFSPLMQGLLIGGGSAYLGIFLFKALLMIKESSSCADTYLCKRRNTTYTLF